MSTKEKEGISQDLEFGNGYSLKYFKVLWILFIPFSLLEILYSFLILSVGFMISGDSAAVFDDRLYAKIQIGVTFLNIALIAVASMLILTEKKRLFAWVFLAKYPLVLVGQGLVILAHNAELPADPSLFTNYLGSIVFFLFFYVPHFIYLFNRLKRSNTTTDITDPSV